MPDKDEKEDSGAPNAPAPASLDADASRLQTRANVMVQRWSGRRGPVRQSLPPHIQAKEHVRSPLQRVGRFSAHFLLEEPKQTPVAESCEVLVVGSGPAGLRAGADVLLVERFGCFGGVITTVGMETLGWYRYEGTTDVQGLGIEMERLAEQMGGAIKWPYNDSQCLDADFFKIVADHLVRSTRNIRPLLHTWVVDAVMEGKTIVGVVTESKSGRRAIRAERVVDCSGDADVAYFAGARFHKFEKKDMLGVTTVFNASGVDKARFLEYTEKNPATYADWSRGEWKQFTAGKEEGLKTPYLDEQFEAAMKAGVFEDPAKVGASIQGTWSALSDAGEATNLNLVHLQGVDGTDVHDLTRAEMEGRRQAMSALKALKAVVPGFEHAKLRNFGMTLGVRDTRKICGRYELTKEDVLGEARFEDAVGIFPEFVDGYNVLVLPTTGRYFHVPFGILISEDVDNLLVGGRCVAGDRLSHAAMRNMMACTVTGQACGAAAAMSVQHKVSVLALDVALVQEELKRQGVRLF
jgi:hypothetical protein